MDDIFQQELGAASPPPRPAGRNVFQVIWQRRALVLFGVVVGAALGFLTYSQRHAVYRSAAQVLVVKKQDSNALTFTGGDPRMAMTEDYIGTHLIAIRSPKIVSMAFKKRNLGALNSLQGHNPIGTIQLGLDARREISKDGSQGGGNNVINLTFTGSDPGDCETILAAVIESYKDFLDETYRTKSEDTVEMIRATVDKLTKDLAQTHEEYRKFRDESPILILGGEKGTSFHETKALEYQKKVADSLELEMTIQKRIEEVQKAIDEKQPREVILALAERRYEKGASNSKNSATALATALLPLLQQEAELSQFYGEDFPELVRIRQRIKMMENFHKRLDEISRESETLSKGNDPVESVLQNLKMEHKLAQFNRSLNETFYTDEHKKAKGLASFSLTDQKFRDNISSNKKFLETAQNRLKEINLLRDYGGFDAQALTPPGPGGKISPVFWQFLIMGLALGFGVGAGSAYLLDLADKSFRTPDEIRRRLGLPIVGHVPFVPASLEPVKTFDGAGNPVELEPGLIALHQPASPASEGFRGIRTALYFSTHGQRHTVIQVTSPNMGDGKTTLITNLAVSIAQSGRKVLIVDADLRRPRVHRAFGLAGKVGLAEVIAGTAELDEAIQITVIPNLSVLPCGRRPQNPAELLTAPRFEDIVDDLRGAFDYVLIDTPPLLAVSDPCIVAPRVDGLLLTIRLSKNGRPAAERARDILSGLKVNCIGLVVNGVGRHGTMTGYGYEHYKYSDEYTTAYTSTDGDNHAETPEGDASGSATGIDAAKNGSHSLNVAVEPSTNGHAAHPILGE
jgi:capsular exopolysaccharide synthesis family protein